MSSRHTLGGLTLAQLQLIFLLFRLVALLLAEEFVEVSLVTHVGDDHEEWEEAEGEDGLPDLDLVRGGHYQHNDQPDVGEQREGRRDAEHNKVLNPGIVFSEKFLLI